MITPTYMSHMCIHTHAHMHKYLRSCGREDERKREGMPLEDGQEGELEFEGAHAVKTVR